MELLAAAHKIQTSDIVWTMTTTLIVIVVLIGITWFAQKWIRSWMGDQDSEVDYHQMLAEYRELKLQGKITDEEFRKLKRQLYELDPGLKSLIPSQKSNSDEQIEPESPSN